MNVNKEYFLKEIDSKGRQLFEERLAAYLASDTDYWGHEEICDIVLTGYKGLNQMTDDELAEELAQYYSAATIEEFEATLV